MRSVLSFVVMSMVVAAASADACPRGTHCIAAANQEVAAISVPRPEFPRARRLRLTLTADVVQPKPVLAMTPARAHTEPGEIEMPWIWQVLRSQFYQRMPTYEGERELTMRLSPVVVAGQYDTIPGVGVAGQF